MLQCEHGHIVSLNSCQRNYSTAGEINLFICDKSTFNQNVNILMTFTSKSLTVFGPYIENQPNVTFSAIDIIIYTLHIQYII